LLCKPLATEGLWADQRWRSNIEKVAPMAGTVFASGFGGERRNLGAVQESWGNWGKKGFNHGRQRTEGIAIQLVMAGEFE
jgi:hypothetical protein